MSVYRLSVVVEKDEDGYAAFCPELDGCYTQGDTYEEVMDHIRDAMKLHIEDRVASGEDVTSFESISLTSMEVVV